jgi:NDP-sugar pyrophosphorylase family protein
MSWFPEYLLPVVNKPIVSLTIELLVQHGVKEIILVLKHMPYETEQYLGNGERWGVNISYSLENNCDNLTKTLQHISTRLDDAIIVCSSNTISNINISELIQSHQINNADFTFAESLENTDKTLANENRKSIPKYSNPFILSQRAIDTIVYDRECNTFDQIISNLTSNNLKINPYRSDFYIKQITSVSDYWRINKSILSGNIKGLILPGWEIRNGIRIGRNTNIDVNSVLSPPIIIGDNCKIGKNVKLNKNCVIGDNVIIDDDSIVENSIILSGTYVGPHNEVKNSLARKNNLYNLTRKISTFVNEDFILGDVEKKTFTTNSERIINYILSLLLLTLSSPILIILIIYNLICPSKKLLASKKQICGAKLLDLKGNYEPEFTNLYYFQSGLMLLRKLPGLFNVLKGDINLIGIYPPAIETVFKNSEFLRYNDSFNQIGLFTLVELEPMEKITEDQKIAINNYYKAKRSVWFDMAIILKSLFKSK